MSKELYSKIVAGEVQLLTAEDICTRLGVSRTTFDRWVRNSSTKVEGGLAALARHGIAPPSPSGFQRAVAMDMAIPAGQPAGGLGDAFINMAEGKIEFPQPDVRIGRSPRWTFETVVAWLEKIQHSKVTYAY